MNLTTKICGWLVALAWLACAATGFFYVYLLLTFYIFSPKTVAQNFRENRIAVISSCVAAGAFLVAAVGVLLARPWARPFSLVLCGLGAFVGAAEAFAGNPTGQPFGAALVAMMCLIFGWLFSRSGRTYFGQVAQSV